MNTKCAARRHLPPAPPAPPPRAPSPAPLYMNDGAAEAPGKTRARSGSVVNAVYAELDEAPPAVPPKGKAISGASTGNYASAAMYASAATAGATSI